MYRYYWRRMVRYGPPCIDGLYEEIGELLAEDIMSIAWCLELLDVIHTLLRMVHPRLGILVYPVVRKHALREMGVYKHRR
jgi:hypothetical protein